MTSTGMAPNIGMLPRPPLLPGILLAVLQRLPLEGDVTTRWPMHGLTWSQRQSGAALRVTNADCSQADITDNPRVCQEETEQLPFTISDALELSPSNWMAIDGDGGGVDAELLSNAAHLISAAFASELVTGAGSGGLSLAGEATAPTGIAFGDAATPLWNALTVIESELAERLLNGQGMIHLPPAMLAQAVDVYSLRWMDGHWVTPLGNIVVADAGYVGMADPYGDGAAAAAAGEDWIYGSGPVWFLSTDDELNGAKFTPENFTFSTNDIERWVKSYGMLIFEPRFVTAVLTAYDPAGA